MDVSTVPDLTLILITMSLKLSNALIFVSFFTLKHLKLVLHETKKKTRIIKH